MPSFHGKDLITWISGWWKFLLEKRGQMHIASQYTLTSVRPGQLAWAATFAASSATRWVATPAAVLGTQPMKNPIPMLQCHVDVHGTSAIVKPSAAMHVTCLYQLYRVVTIGVEDSSWSHTTRIIIAIKQAQLQSINWYQIVTIKTALNWWTGFWCNISQENDILKPQDIHITG